ncbi:cupin domain-containing protein [Bacillus sp. Marseille-P3661]|uniref:cupin domain-containing protein n=1 Tax=Bacillus sp. Marseille-P3661 TaxID=1936234 RepID=UPI000C8681E9|nr:cupin domain-containing protein [Bacillus sp. Marseille-P3661]
MAIKAVNLKEMANSLESRKVILMNGPKFHTWLHVYHNPGDHDEMHCHNADQTFYCIDGECTVYYKDGDKEKKDVLKPGMVALIPGGQFYWIKNTGSSKMVLMGSRALSYEQSMKIDYTSRENVNAHKLKEPPKATKILI